MKRKTTAALAVIALSATLAACATPTPYQPVMRGTSASGGFTDARLTDNRFRVSFSGNSLTSRETVERYLLFRAAELTTQTGYDWFEFIDRQTDRDRRTYVDSDPFYRGGWGGGFGPGWGGGWGGPGWGGPGWRPAWRFYGAGWGGWGPWGDPFWGNRYDVRTIDKFEATAEIMLHRGPAPAENPRAFDARQVQANLGPSIQRPQPPQ